MESVPKAGYFWQNGNPWHTAMTINRLIPNICSDLLVESKQFYTELLGFTLVYDSDWYVQVTSPRQPRLELGFIQRQHELVPEPYRTLPQGMYLTLVVDDVDAIYAQAQLMGLEVLQPPQDEFYGQRRMLITDPNGLLLDVSTPISK
jgi:catechol 2,3-dioxygenase-like lactoylglutathione lyase family enzyme